MEQINASIQRGCSICGAGGCTNPQIRNPLAGLLFVADWPARVIRPVFNGAEQRFLVGIVVAHPRPGEGSEYPQFP